MSNWEKDEIEQAFWELAEKAAQKRREPEKFKNAREKYNNFLDVMDDAYEAFRAQRGRRFRRLMPREARPFREFIAEHYPELADVSQIVCEQYLTDRAKERYQKDEPEQNKGL